MGMYKVTLGRKIVAGDEIRVKRRRIKVKGTQRVQGRKPKKGENILLMTTHGKIKLNSLDPVRVWRD